MMGECNDWPVTISVVSVQGAQNVPLMAGASVGFVIESGPVDACKSEPFAADVERASLIDEKRNALAYRAHEFRATVEFVVVADAGEHAVSMSHLRNGLQRGRQHVV